MAYGPPRDKSQGQGGGPHVAQAPVPDEAFLKTLTAQRGSELYKYCEEGTRDARKKAMRDHEYYDSKQWTQKEADDVEQRGQPVVVQNLVAPAIDHAVGFFAQRQIDPMARPRTITMHDDDARAATDMLRYLADVERFDDIRPLFAFDCILKGIGAVFIGGGEEEGSIAEIVWISWDRLITDPRSRMPLYEDSNVRGFATWYPIDEASAKYPQAKDQLENMARNAPVVDEFHPDLPQGFTCSYQSEKRVLVVDLWIKNPADRNWYYMCFSGEVLLSVPAISPYIGWRKGKQYATCPLVLASCKISHTLDRYGLARPMISPQEMVNKTLSKAIHAANVDRSIGEAGAVDDIAAFQAERAKPDGFAVVNDGAMVEGRIKTESGLPITQVNLQMMQIAASTITKVGPISAGIPDLPGSSSGVAIEGRVDQAERADARVFNQIRAMEVEIFTHLWDRARQFCDQEMWVRVTDDDEDTGYRFTGVNLTVPMAQRLKQLTDKGVDLPRAMSAAAGASAPMLLDKARLAALMVAQQQQQQPQAPGQPPQQQPQQDPQQMLLAELLALPEMQQPVRVNDIAQTDVDIIIDEVPEYSTGAQRQFEVMAKQIGPMYAQSGKPLPLKAMIRASDLPDKRQIIRELEETEKPNPQAMQMQQQVMQLDMQTKMATLELTKAQAQLTAAQAMKAKADAQARVMEAQAGMAEAQAAGVQPQQAQADLAKTAAEIRKLEAQTAQTVAETQMAMMPDITMMVPSGEP